MSDVSGNPLLYQSAQDDSRRITPSSMIDGLLQRWVEDMESQKTRGQNSSYISWQPSSAFRGVELAAKDAVIWGQAKITGMHQSLKAVPFVFFAIDRSAARLVINSFLGPNSVEASSERPYTQFEKDLIEHFWTQMLAVLTQTWNTWEVDGSPNPGIAFEWLGAKDHPPALGRTYDGIMSWPLKITDGQSEEGGVCHLIIPQVTLEPLLPQLQDRFVGDSLGHDELWREHWNNIVSEGGCDIEVRTPAVHLNLRDVLTWSVGTEIALSPLLVAHAYCHDYHMMTGSVGHKNGCMAFQMQCFDTYNERSCP